MLRAGKRAHHTDSTESCPWITPFTCCLRAWERFRAPASLLNLSSTPQLVPRCVNGPIPRPTSTFEHISPNPQSLVLLTTRDPYS
jgi:hypothetical protein